MRSILSFVVLLTVASLRNTATQQNNPTIDNLVNFDIRFATEQKKSENYCIRNRGYNMGWACDLSNYKGFMNAVEFYLRRQSSMVDKANCPPYRDDKVNLVDFVVVGSGVGSVVARRLAERGYSVTLLEAGSPAPIGTQIPGTYFQYLKYPDLDWNFPLEKQKNACGENKGVCYWPKGKMMGGTTQLHGMMYMRGYPQDFNNWNLTGWSWDDVLDMYLYSEDNQNIGNGADWNYHGTDGLLTVSRFPHYPPIADDILNGAAEMGFNTRNDMNGDVRTGFTLAQATVKNGERLSTSRAYLYNPKVQLKNLKIRTSAFVTRVLFDNNKRAIGVEYKKNGITHTIKVRKEVVVSCGTIQSPQLLMVSGIGPREHLEKHGITVIHDSPGVGQNLRNHASVQLRFKVKGDDNADQLNAATLAQFLFQRKGPLTSTGLSQLTGFFYSSSKIDRKQNAPDFQMFFDGYLAACSRNGSGEAPNNPKSTRMISMIPSFLRPKSVGYIELASGDPEKYPKIHANILSVKEDVITLIKGIRIALKLANTTPLRNKIELALQKCPYVKTDNSDKYWECIIRYYTYAENYQVGTCKMGRIEDLKAVTDERLRVYGVSKLRVIDSSILPTCPSGNLVAPAIMVAENGAKMIIQDWLHRNTK